MGLFKKNMTDAVKLRGKNRVVETSLVIIGKADFLNGENAYRLIYRWLYQPTTDQGNPQKHNLHVSPIYWCKTSSGQQIIVWGHSRSSRTGDCRCIACSWWWAESYLPYSYRHYFFHEKYTILHKNIKTLNESFKNTRCCSLRSYLQ